MSEERTAYEVITLDDARNALRRIKDLNDLAKRVREETNKIVEHNQAKLREKAGAELEAIEIVQNDQKEFDVTTGGEIAELEAQIKEYILVKGGSSVILDDPLYPGVQAVYSEGQERWDPDLLWAALLSRPELWAAVKVSWDSKVLKKLAIEDESLLQLRSKGDPYVSLKGVK